MIVFYRLVCFLNSFHCFPPAPVILREPCKLNSFTLPISSVGTTWKRFLPILSESINNKLRTLLSLTRCNDTYK